MGPDELFSADNLIGPNRADLNAANLDGPLGQCEAGRAVVAFVMAFGLEDILRDLL
jgi:hypothetical protein